jgi:large subunit ribosomal protein L9
MKVLLLQDVYNLGRAGEVKKVAAGYGRNYLVPHGLALLATPDAIAQAGAIAEEADKRRAVMNDQMSIVAEKFTDLNLFFAARAGETGKLYGSVTTQMIADKLGEELSLELDKRQIDAEPLRQLGMHTVKARLTVDIVPEFHVVVYREGEAPENYMIDAEELADLAQGGDVSVSDVAEDIAEEESADTGEMAEEEESIVEEQSADAEDMHDAEASEA